LEQAVEGLGKLRGAGIPVVAVEGNHERPHYRDEFGWLDFLRNQGYLILLAPEFDDEGNPMLHPYENDSGGAYIDFHGVRVYGVKYYGAAMARVVESLPAALAQTDRDGIEYTVMLLHSGLEDVLPHQSGVVDHSLLTPLRPYVDYLALGHLHKPFERDDWIYNPGSLETVSIDEAQWPERGYYYVEVDTTRRTKHRAQLIPCPRRAFVRLSQDLSELKTPHQVNNAIERLAKRKADQSLHKPVVEIELHGVLQFDVGDLDMDRVKEIITEAFDPVHVLVKNAFTPTKFEIVEREGESRPELELRVLKDLFERDARFQPDSGDWANIAVQVKRMALEEASPAAIVEYLRKRRETLMDGED
jgi:exonuclease SbcD